MGLFDLLLLVLAGSLHGGERHYVRIDAAKWAHVEAAAPQSLGTDERLWSWSSACAPSTASDCAPGATVRVRVIDAKRQPVPSTRVTWATAKMAAEIPDALLPTSTTDDAGVAELMAPLAEPLFARAAGPRLVSDWQDARRTPLLVVAAADVVVEALDENGKRARHVRASVVPLDLAADGRPKISAAADDGAIRLLLPRSSAFRATLWSDELAPAERTAMAAALGGTIVLHPGATVRGSVRNGKGESLAGARVQLVFAVDGKSGVRRQTRTGDDGRFELRGIPPGKCVFSIVHDSCASLRRDLELPTGPTDLRHIELAAARSVRVLVVDVATAKPIAGATVRVANGESATTAASGTAVLEHLGGDDEIDVDVAADAYLASRARLPLDAKAPAVRLTRGAAVRGTVVARDTRAPVGPGSVWVDLAGTKMIRSYDAAGRLHLTGLAGGALELEIRAPGFAAHKIARREIAVGEVVDLGRIELDRGRAIVGTVVDAVTGEPLPSARIRTPRPNAAGPRLALVMNDWIETSVDENGDFRVGGILPGDYRLLVESSGHAPLLTDNITVAGDNDVAAGPLKLARAHRLKIVCSPARRCGSVAELLLGDGNDDWATLRAPLADGKGDLIPAPEGEHRLRLLDHSAVVAEKSVTIVPDTESQEVTISIPETEVRGTVTRGGRPAAGGSVQFVGHATSQAIPVFVERRLDKVAVSSDVVGTLSRFAAAPVDASGNFVTTELGAGDYDATYSGGSGESPAQRVSIPDVRSFSFRIDIAAAALSGTVRDERGHAPEWARIELQGPASSTSIDVAPDGRFSIDGVPSGRATVRAFNDSSEAVREVVLEDGRTATADLVLHDRAKAEVRGRVISAEGLQVAGATVFFLCDGALKSATSDARGIAEISLAASTATCSGAAFAADRGWAFAAPVTVSASSGGDAAEVSIRFVPRAVTISLASGRPAAVGIVTPTGFPLERAFPFVGWPSGVSASAPLRLRGMPPGSYFIRLSSGDSRALSVDGTKDVAISF
jgi:hypothetical protein